MAYERFNHTQLVSTEHNQQWFSKEYANIQLRRRPSIFCLTSRTSGIKVEKMSSYENVANIEAGNRVNSGLVMLNNKIYVMGGKSFTMHGIEISKSVSVNGSGFDGVECLTFFLNKFLTGFCV